MARCVFVYTNFGKFPYPKTILPFLQKGEKTSELVFCFFGKLGLEIQTRPN